MILDKIPLRRIYTHVPVADAPEWARDLAGRAGVKRRDAIVSAEIDTDQAVRRAAAYLEIADTAVQGNGGDNHTYKVAATVLDFGVSPEMALDLMLEHWNERCSPPWQPDELQTKIDNAAGYRQEPIGSKNPEAEFEPVDPATQDDLPPFPIDAINLPGLLGDTIRHICVTSPAGPQPELALMNILAAAAAVFGQRYAIEWFDTRTNIYLVGVAGTGSGKDHSRKKIRKLFEAASLDQYLGASKTPSAQGLVKSLTKRPAQIMMIDEFGEWLKAIGDTKGAQHLKMIAPLLLELYSTSSSSYVGGQRASGDDGEIRINQPNLCVYGTSTLETYVEALTSASIKNGSLNRFVVVPTRTDYPEFDETAMPSSDWPDEIVAQWAVFNAPATTSAHDQFGPTIVRHGDTLPEIHAMKREQDRTFREAGPETGPLWGRYRENALKIAMVLAIMRNPVAPVLTPGDLKFAKDFVGWSCQFMHYLATGHLADSEHERVRNTLAQIIRSAGLDGIGRSAITRRTQRISARSREDALRVLQDEERIRCVTTQGARGRPSDIFYWIIE